MAKQPDLENLLSGYLARQADAHALGLGPQESAGEVVPYDAGPVQPVDARLAWTEAVVAASLLMPDFQATSWKAPPSWPALVAAHDPEIALPLSIGNYPQLVRNLHPLWQASDLTQLRPGSSRSIGAPGLEEWATETAAKKQFPSLLLAVGTLRLAGQFEHAARLLPLPDADVPTEWRPAWVNEKAALAWHQGHSEAARALWDAQPTTVPVLFNRGMAALFLGSPDDARGLLSQAVAQLPEDGAWHHLGRLYLALAQAR